jgi:histidinol dehydrogenase
MKIWQWPNDRRKIENWFDRAGQASEQVEETARRIIRDVRSKGDREVARLTRRFDGAKIRPGDFDVSLARLKEAWDQSPLPLRKALRQAKKRIETFHQKQRLKGWSILEPGFGRIDMRVIPMERVAVYVPNGVAPLVSTVLMDVIPARVAGVRDIILVSPPDPDGLPHEGIMAAAHLVGVDRFLRIGGSPAMPALAYGTETIPRVDKVVGPGNIYVATMKRLLYGRFDIESVAGPSEVLILADRTACLDYVAADLLAQAEHDGNNPTGVVLIGGGKKRADKLVSVVHEQLDRLSRRKLAGKSIRDQGYIICVRKREDAVMLANMKAPEHLEIMTENPRELANGVNHAGAVFIGPWTPEPVGDYIAGPNHTLPTGGTARFFSPLSVWSFYRTCHMIEASKNGLARLAGDIITLAETEQLTAHAASVGIRGPFRSPKK